jgi:hypothetical protein
MRPLQSQRKFAILWIFVFVLFQAVGRPLHLLSGCPQSCGTGSNCCVLDASHLQNESTAKQEQVASKRTCSHCHSHEKSQKPTSETGESGAGKAAHDESNWISRDSHECAVCQWFATPSLSTLEFNGDDSHDILISLNRDRTIDIAATVTTEQSPRGPPE